VVGTAVAELVMVFPNQAWPFVGASREKNGHADSIRRLRPIVRVTGNRGPR